METSTIAKEEKIQKQIICKKTDAYSFLEFTKPSIGTLSREKHSNKQCSLQLDAY
jgi:hypothetical protein